MGSQYAATLGLIALAATVIRSWLNGVDAGTAMVTAVLYLAAFAFLGWLIGCLATHVVVKSVIDSLHRELEEREASKSSTATADGR
jgi:hypothetical protein